MAINKAPFAIKGMTRDLAASKFSSEYAYENKNMRIVATDSNTGGALTNEKGNRRIARVINGIPIGQATINDNLIVFSSGYRETSTPTSKTDTLKSSSFSVKSYNSKYDALADIEGVELDYRYNVDNVSYYTGGVNQWIGYTNSENKRIAIGPIGDEYPLVTFTEGNSSTITVLYIQEEITEGQEYFPSATNFSIGEGRDYIYKLHYNEDNSLENTLLYSGELNFDVGHPIESISVYENSELQKVYWTDGKNQPRVLNLNSTFNNIVNGDDYFNFIRKLRLEESITINKNTVASGYFAPGVIQYCFTYFNLYGQESNIFYTSPLYYISYNTRGASPEDTVSNSFTINISSSTIDTNFQYVRIYCIHRTSLNSIPQVRKVVDLAIPASRNTSIVFTDNGNEGSNISPTELLYVGGEPIIAGTMAQKNNTLFLGDIKTLRPLIPSTIKEELRGEVEFYTELRYGNDKPVGLYPYSNLLKFNSSDIRTFKYLEYYRFGVQFQHYTGRWSEPIWIGDKQNTSSHPEVRVFTRNNVTSYLTYLPQVRYFINSELSTSLKDLGYINARPVVVFPKLNERNVICQGVLAPTVYNVGDRSGNSPFAQSSWFFRPNSYLDVDSQTVKDYWIAPSQEVNAENCSNSVAAQVYNAKTTALNLPDPIDNFNRGKWVEFRHNATIPQNNKENAEIQCLYGNASTPYNEYSRRGSSRSITINTYVSKYKENFFVDQSIVTLHSPDIEFDTQVRSLDTSSLKLRIVGYIPLTASVSDISIKSATPVSNFLKVASATSSEIEYFDDAPIGAYKEPITTANLSQFGWRSIVSGGFWLDEISGRKIGKSNTDKYSTGFVIYPWHRTGSYNNAKVKDSSETRPSKTDSKKLSILRYSYNTEYLNSTKIWKALNDESTTNTGISDVVIFDSDEVSLVRLKSPSNSGLDDISYYGNVDKVITFTSVQDNASKEKGYPIVCSGMTGGGKSTHDVLTGNYILPSEELNTVNHDSLDDISDQYLATDPVSMKYKSTPHAVLALNYTSDGYQRILPTNKFTLRSPDESFDFNANDRNVTATQYTFWDTNYSCSGVSQDILPIYPTYGYLWLGELYNDDSNLDSVRFGGQTEEAFENNNWLPAGDVVKLGSTNGETDLIWIEGDTFYQRYDCLKTYPYTLEDENSVVDILSFMCETRVNLDGRYDRNRGQTSNLTMTPSNFNLLNPVYSQQNNFFNYRGINSNKISAENFPNTVTWTKTKTLGETVDSWTNVTLASTLDLDGTFGKVRAIRKFKDSLVAFQDRAISQILYDESVQIASTTGVPIEIANSGKVSGKRYISEKIGCLNKWSICSTPNGLYFHDNISRDLYLFNGEFNNLSDKLGFHSWVISNLSSNQIWNPEKFYDEITFYDKENNDVLFITKDTCLAFSESIGQFTSFYDYENTPVYETIKDNTVAIHQDPNGEYYPYLQHSGPYNQFFGIYKPYWTTVVVNPTPIRDKIFNNVEFRADSFSNNTLISDFTFDTLNVWNEYQEGIQTLNNTKDIPSTLKKKFRIWHAQIPRWNVNKNGYTANGRDRIRNPWIYLKLSMENSENLVQNYKTVLHDLVVDYFE